MVDQVCKFSGTELKEIDAFALSQGPGSYTGLRIGSSALKGLCYALDKPLIAISTLQLMAEGLRGIVSDSDWICPMIDARRMEVYQGIFDSSGQIVDAEKALILEGSTYDQFLEEKKIIFAGSGAEKCSKIIHHKNALFIKEYHPLDKNMGATDLKAFEKKAFADIAYFEPEYLKEFYTSAKILN